uniref:Squalene cyclase C-terminal domain-containing protein n=1 Tax=Oryza sativa subsp. japonica TaxID=39947 RepID=Q60EU2_ORYSJ|nr:hypothetical protein [Oryza sativa Japonica Group]
MLVVDLTMKVLSMQVIEEIHKNKKEHDPNCRSLKTLQTMKLITAIDQKVRGHYQQQIMDGVYLIVLLKHLRSVVQIKTPPYVQIALLMLSKISPDLAGDAINGERLYDAVDGMLSFMGKIGVVCSSNMNMMLLTSAYRSYIVVTCQVILARNKDGTFSTYECERTTHWLEVLNPSKTFLNIIVDYPSVECTSSVLQALIMFSECYPVYRKEEIGKCIKNASKFIENKQRKDGSWPNHFEQPSRLYSSISKPGIYHSKPGANQIITNYSIIYYATPVGLSPPLLSLVPRNEPCYTKDKAVAHAGLWLARLMFHNRNS